MKKIVCEMCDSTEFVKQDGVFVCQSCGMKYTVEEAKKLMVEVDDGNVTSPIPTPAASTASPVAAPAPAANDSTVENYLNLAKNALENSNNEEAESYANKILEIVPNHAWGWQIKGAAAAWQSTASNSRLREAVSAWHNAVKFAAEKDVVEIKGAVEVAFKSVWKALISLHAGNFANLPNEENRDRIIRTLDDGKFFLNDLTVRSNVRFSRAPLYSSIASTLNDKVVEAYNQALEDFGETASEKTKYKWDHYTDVGDHCLRLLDIIVEYVRTPSLGVTVCNNMVIIGEGVRDSCSWKFEADQYSSGYVRDYSFTDEAKKSRTHDIDVSKNWKKFFENDSTGAILSKLEDLRGELEIIAGRDAYWSAHRDEKEAIQREIEQITAENAELKKSIEALPEKAEADAANKSISSLEHEREALGIFKFKEKKALSEQIDRERATLRIKLEAFNNAKRGIEAKMAQGEVRKKELNDELFRERGRCSEPDPFLLKGAVVDGEFNTTPEKLVAHMSRFLPAPYAFDALETATCSLHNEYERCWAVCVENTEYTTENKSIGVLIFMKAQSAIDKIESIVVQTSCNRDVDDIVEWVRIASLVLTSLLPDLDLEKVEKMCVNAIMGEESSVVWQGGLSIEYVDYELETDDNTLKLKSLLIKP